MISLIIYFDVSCSMKYEEKLIVSLQFQNNFSKTGTAEITFQLKFKLICFQLKLFL